jgi:hypothetical protein
MSLGKTQTTPTEIVAVHSVDAETFVCLSGDGTTLRIGVDVHHDGGVCLSCRQKDGSLYYLMADAEMAARMALALRRVGRRAEELQHVE